ncbi:MAG TPA: hypothetical protein VJN18_10300 [Polyangiaceae bacterium]|nr:hypothetical protein [Polyangiaceae bacterium]
MIRRLALTLMLALASGCGDDQAELEQASLGIHAADITGREADIACEQLPLLQGSRSYGRHVIDDRLVIEVVAEPIEVTLRFENIEGVEVSQPLSLRRGTLLMGGDPRIVQLVVEQRQYFVTLSMGCEP